jgi:hypothetical protein
MASLAYQTPSDMATGNGESAQHAPDEFAAFESLFPFPTIDGDDFMSEIALSESIPFSTIDSDDFILVFGPTNAEFCCESRCLDYTDFVLKQCPFERELDGRHDIKAGKKKVFG